MRSIFLTVLIILCKSALSQTPELLWKFSTGACIIGSPVADDSCIYAGNTTGMLYAIQNDSAKLKWKFITGGSIRSTICINKQQLFLVSGDGNLYCLNKNSGKTIWVFHSLTGFIGDTQHDFADYYQSSPVVYNNAVYFGSGDGNIYSIDIASGNMNWKFATAGNVHTTPSVKDNKLFIGSFDGDLYALNSSTGNLIWKFKSTGHQYFPKGEMMGDPVVAGDIVFAGSRDYNFYAIDINGGYCRWMKQFPKGWALPVTVNDSVIYVGTSEDRLLLAIDINTGNIKWQTAVPFNIFGRCAITKRNGYFGTLMGKVYGIDLTTGKIQWTFNTDGYNKNHLKYFKPDDSYKENIGEIVGSAENIAKLYNETGAVFSTPLIISNKIIVTSADGNIYCLRSTN
ncbi:outer membrane protein assembly factor BamB family protein [Ferruginibacter albus]|uniref:outer membrane protein assembly factor BamB family protein n=1 Tax=Ferruginibacter albus TaxID=2875540 RepID=UPI001CC4AEE2|nr:PQQ-binding-like beta-propeller repeat protein [Ferruginibacter albus]UAY52772.1 PQQ-binding-like beta-propeller repeat protein [Ferruginibacter albus]